jgi:hypothetical protein
MSRRLKRLLLLLLVFIQIGTQVLWAAFDDWGVGARAPGMADVYTAVSDNADALYYNPAGLVQMREAQISTQYGDLLKGTSDGSSNTNGYLGFAQPLQNGRGTLGFGYTMFNASDLLSERTILVSYGRQLKEPIFGWNGLWSFGVNGKQLYRQFKPNLYTSNALDNTGTGTGQTDPLFARKGYDKTAYAMDAGLMVRFGPGNRHSAGLSLMNINQPDISLGGDGDKPPLITKLGLATKPKWGLLSVEVRQAHRLNTGSDTDFAVGAERRFNLSEEGQAFTLRGGYAQGSREYKAFTTGLSYDFGRVGLDYSFSFPLGALSQTSGTHRFGLTFKFSPLLPKEKEAASEVPNPTGILKLPEAPTPLVAPHPVIESDKKKMNEFESDAKNFGALLGVYFTRKSQGATPEERMGLLKQIKALYTNRGIDMSLVDNELKELETVAVPSPTPSPTPIPTPKPVPAVQEKSAPIRHLILPKPVAKPTPKPVSTPKKVKTIKVKNFESMSSLSQLAATSPELEQALKYYHLAVERGISDNERIEVLEAILLRFGEPAAQKITGELERLRRRNR